MMTAEQRKQVEGLIPVIEAIPLLGGRFEKLAHVPVRRGGTFSIVFKAWDVAAGKHVLVKFFNFVTTPSSSPRADLFRHEPTILKALIGSRRCLQLVEGLAEHSVALMTPAGFPLTITAQYFVTEWLEGDILEQFFDRERFSPEDRLKLFVNIVLAVRALHTKEVVHRDLKVDNLMERLDELKRVIVAIDMGCAAIVSAGPRLSAYDYPVGFKPYSPPEAHCGLAGIHAIGHKTDVYALGCLLFELFNAEEYAMAFLRHNPSRLLTLNAMCDYVRDAHDDAARISQWALALRLFAAGFTPIDIDGPGSSIPTGVVDIVNEVMRSMTDVDYRRRPSLDRVVQRIQIAIKVLGNQRYEQERRARILKQRKVREDNQRQKDIRVKALTKPSAA